MNIEDFERFKVEDLKAYLSERGLSYSAKQKKELAI